MKSIMILGHPVALVVMFFLLLIEGDYFGGFYLLYLLLAAPHGAPYALVALLGLIAVFTGYEIQRRKFRPISLALQLVGFGLMLLSLILFFAKGNKNATFEETIPLISFLLFAIVLVCFLIRIFSILAHSKLHKNQKLDTAI